MDQNGLYEDAIARITDRTGEENVVYRDAILYNENGKFLGKGLVLNEDIARLAEVVTGDKCIAMLSREHFDGRNTDMGHILRWATYLIAEGRLHYCRCVPDEPEPYEIERGGLCMTVIGEREMRRLLGI